MRHGREQAELIKLCAARHGITPRGVRKWRDQGDERWVKFLAERAAAGAVAVGSCSLPPASPREWKPEDISMDAQVRKLKEATADLHERAELAKLAGRIDDEMALRRMWLQHTESLRRLEKDAPSISRESGDVIPRRPVEQALLGYVSNVVSHLEQLPDRFFSLFPDLPTGAAEKLRDEVNVVRTAAASLSLADVLA
jgi:hypothetical protein